MKAVCIIPARGGSKRIPRKNIKDFLGKPIIAYSIEAALKSGLFDEVMVSTDDDEIADVARRYGASVPFMRSDATSNDFATTNEVIAEVLDRYRDAGKEFDVICCLYSTAPFVTEDRLREALGELCKGECESVFTGVAYSYPVLRGIVMGERGYAEMKWPQYRYSRSQDLEKFYHDAGQFYMYTGEYFKKGYGLAEGRARMLELSELEVQDLDTPTDWKLAELKYSLINK